MTLSTTLQPLRRRLTPTGPPAPPGRDPFFDNAKFLLVVLVVIGHNWAVLVRDMETVKAAYTVLYLFHMPAFVLLCGLFSRGFTGTGPQIRALLTRVLAPYLLFTVAYKALQTLIYDAPFALTPTEPTYLLWFLVALFLWRITAPVWRAVRHPVALAVLISLAAGLTGIGYELALPRVLMFLPWFVLGLRLRPEHFHRLRTRAVRRSAPLVLLAALALAYAIAPHINANWLYMRNNNAELQTGSLEYLAIRLGLFVVSAALIVAFFALVPARRTVFTALGAATMFPFLVHGLLVQTGQAYGMYELVGRLGAGALLLLALFGVAVTAVLSSAPVRRVLRPVVEPRFPRFLIPDDSLTVRQEAAGESSVTSRQDATRAARNQS
ncbi:acyltransferase family protein [Streptomyces sp. LHD-70]|uniref:acyltransferase family protein n=1 Tax=Streptomyces sp. LHD-70 TaxID=3072140 RepID=UPI00280CA85F|nr:acyltransferase family protein [Streptomyces sp. LHD-70]MDQ8702830.1 acyltransferase family protein [Streptomyces sp. LHD-70]